MAVYRQIQITFWQDGFVLELTLEEKYFYLYLMSNSKTTQCGIYELPKKIIEIETGYNRETVEKLLKRFIEYGKILYSQETQEIMLLNWIKYNGSNSPKVKSKIEKELKEIKYKEFGIKYYRLSIPYLNSIDTRSQKKQEQEEGHEESGCSSEESQNEIQIVLEEFQRSGYGQLNYSIKEILVHLVEEYGPEWVIEL